MLPSDITSRLPGEPPFGLTTTDETADELKALIQFSRRMNDPIWSVSAVTVPYSPGMPLDRSRQMKGVHDLDKAVPGKSVYHDRCMPLPATHDYEVDKLHDDEVDKLPTVPTTKARQVMPGPRTTATWGRPLSRLRDLAGLLSRPPIRLGRWAYRKAMRVEYHSGEEILAEVDRRKLLSLMAIERALPHGADFGMAVGSACVVLELAIGELINSTRHAVRPLNLAAALEDIGRAKQAELLLRWADGRLPMTMGLQVTFLAALEKLGFQGQEHFANNYLQVEPGYLALLRSGRLTTDLERIRTQYRNPACHGSRAFDRAEYIELAQLLLTRVLFRSWYRRGPAKPNTGLLDVHLVAKYGKLKKHA